MKNKQNELESDDIFNNIEFNKNEIKTDENFFNELNNNENNEDISLDLDKSEESLTSDKLDLCDKSMEEQMSKVTLNEENKLKFSKKITKEDLKTIPIPIFECLYCANEDIAYHHLVNEILSRKYLYNAEKKDIILVDFLLNNNPLKLKENKNDILGNFGKENNINLYRLNSLVNMIVINTEYFNKYYNTKDSSNYLKQKRNREDNNKFKNNFSTKDKNKIEEQLDLDLKMDFDNKKYGNNKIELFEDDNSDDDIKELTNKINNLNNLNKNKEDKKEDEGNFMRFFEENCFMDLSRKIKKEDIVFEDKPYNIWEDNIDDSLEKDS